MSNILTKIGDLQRTLNQQDSIYQSHQTLHFDWLNSVLFQLQVYDQNDNNQNILKSENTNTPEINNDTKINNSKTQITINSKPSPPIPKIPEKIHKDQNKCENSKEIESQTSKSNKKSIGPKSGNIELKATPRKIKLGGHRTFTKHTSTPIIPKQHVSPMPPKTILKKSTNSSKQITKDKNEAIPSKKNSLVKFVDNDSLLSISQSSFSSDSLNNDSDSDNIEKLQIQSQPCVINLNELNLSVSCFQEQWQEMVEEKKRATLSPKQPLGVLFEFDDSPNNYQMTDSEDEFMSSDDEIQDSNPVEIHGKIIPIWARKENIEKNLRKQKDKASDEIFTNMPKHCVLEQIFDELPANVLTKSDSGSFDEVDNRNTLIMS